MSDRKFSRAWWRSVLFRFLAMFLRGKTSHPVNLPENPARIMVLAPLLRGDYLILTPLFTALKKRFPRVRLGVVVTKPSFELAHYDPMVNDVLLYQKLPGWFFSIFQIIRYRPDIVIMPKGHPSFTESLLLLLSGSDFRVGLSHPHHNPFLTHIVEHDWENEHRTTAFARIMGLFGVKPENVAHLLHIGKNPDAEAWVVDRFQKIETEPHYISVNISASQESRLWTVEKWKQLIQAVQSIESGCTFVVIAAPADFKEAEELANSFDSHVFFLQTPSFLHASATIAQTEMLITVDTGIVQVAAARHIPSVVLYNGDHEVYTRFAPHSIPHRAILAERGKWVQDISVDEVIDQYESLKKEIEISRKG